MKHIGIGTFETSPLINQYVGEVLRTGRLSYGPFSRELEHRFSEMHDCAFGVLSNSGTSSLQVALQALKELCGWQDGDEVLVPAVTFVATVNVVLHNRMKPVLVDVDPVYYEMNCENLDAAVTDRTRALIPVNLFGQPCELNRLATFAKRRNLLLIEDSCFTGNTLLPTKNGQKRIKEIAIGDKLLGFDGTTFKQTVVVDTRNRLIDYRDLLVIRFANGLTVRCTKEHPFYINGQWVKAGNLKVDDEVWQCNWSEYTTWRREHRLSEAGRRIISENMKANNPSYNPDTVRKSATNRRHRPSTIESRVMQTCSDYGLPIDYVGDGALWIGAADDAYKNPDFVVRRDKTVIEVYDPTFHYHKRTNVRLDRNETWRTERAAFFAKYGYRTEFLELSGYVGRDVRRKLAGRLRQIVSNGARIVSIKPAKKAYVNRYNSGIKEPDNMVRVYNLHCEPHNNFILTSGVLVHNCEAMFVPCAGKMVGSFGAAGCFSFYMAHLLTAGVGGIATTNDPDLAGKMRSLVNHGRDGIYMSIDDDDAMGENLREIVLRRFNFEAVGHSYRITELEAAVALAQLATAEDIIGQRQANASVMTIALRELETAGLVQLPKTRSGTEHAFMMYPLVVTAEAVEDKWGLCNWLEQNGIETREMMRLTDQPAYCKLELWEPADYPVAEWINKRGLYIGCHQGLDADDMRWVADLIADWFNAEGLL